MNIFSMVLIALTTAALGVLLLARNQKFCGWFFVCSLTACCAAGLWGALHILQNGTSLVWSAGGRLLFGEFSFGVDPLSAFFLLLSLIVLLAAGIYGHAYLRGHSGPRNLGVHYFFYLGLVASVLLVLVARNAVLFLAAWELMTLASYFLITFYDEKEEVRKAGLLYFIATHAGFFCLCVMFFMMGHQAGSLDFDRMAAAAFSPSLAGFIFVLALLGFGVKAGLIPLHIWLPYAHPAAPSHVSAALSGVVIKIGIYGLMRVIMTIVHFPSWCGIVLLVVAAVSGVGGVLYALGQHEIKRLLAYHSIENIGIIALGLGMGMTGQAAHQDMVAWIGYAGALLHVFNHAVFKGLLFLSAGSVIRVTHTGEIDHLGGLLKILPWSGHLFLIGSLSICGLPLFNGFISEWLVYQSILLGILHFSVSDVVFACLGLGALALIGALAALCFAKAFGAVFLGHSRSLDKPHEYQEGPWMLRLPMLALAAICVWVGLFPRGMVSLAFSAASLMVPGASSLSVRNEVIAPLEAVTAVFAVGILIFLFFALLRSSVLKGYLSRQAETWACAYAAVSSRMQYTASSFAQPILRIFRLPLLFKTRTEPLKSYFPRETHLRSSILDASEDLVLRPAFYRLRRALRSLRWIQSGHAQQYLLYIFFFLLGLLIWKLY